jgi:hypothetical protein
MRPGLRLISICLLIGLAACMPQRSQSGDVPPTTQQGRFTDLDIYRSTKLLTDEHGAAPASSKKSRVCIGL